MFSSSCLYFEVLAFQNGESAFIATVGLINVFYAFVIDVTVFDTSFNNFQVMGAFLICGFNIVGIIAKINEKPKETLNTLWSDKTYNSEYSEDSCTKTRQCMI